MVLYNSEDGKIVVLPVEKSSVRCRASGSKVSKGGRPEISPKYREDFAHHGMPMVYARLVQRRYLADGRNVRTPHSRNRMC